MVLRWGWLHWNLHAVWQTSDVYKNVRLSFVLGLCVEWFSLAFSFCDHLQWRLLLHRPRPVAIAKPPTWCNLRMVGPSRAASLLCSANPVGEYYCLSFLFLCVCVQAGRFSFIFEGFSWWVWLLGGFWRWVLVRFLIHAWWGWESVCGLAIRVVWVDAVAVAFTFVFLFSISDTQYNSKPSPLLEIGRFQKTYFNCFYRFHIFFNDFLKK